MEGLLKEREERKRSAAELKSKWENLRRFQGTGLDQATLDKMVEEKLSSMNLEVEPLDRLKFDALSLNSKRLLFKHNSNLLSKYDPNLEETFLEDKKQRAFSEFKQMSELQEGEQYVDMTPYDHKEPALKLKNKTDDTPIMYSE